MKCPEVKELMHGYLDAELDLVRSVEMENHLKDCRFCQELYQEQHTLHSLIASKTVYFEAPKNLRENIRSAIHEAYRAENPPSFWAWGWSSFWLPVGTAILVLLIAVPLLIWNFAQGDPVPQQLLRAQVRSLMPGHLVDVPSSDQNTVKPWFNGKLDFSPPVIDLKDDGFILAGGRLDYIDDRPVAAVVYHRNKHCINLFMWPSQKAHPSAEKSLTRQGFTMVHWTESGMNCWAVSDVNKRDLQQFVQLLRNPKNNYSPGSTTKDSTNPGW